MKKTKIIDEELTGSEIVDKYLQDNNIYHFEGDSGVENLEKLVEALGYKDTGFRFGTPVEAFLSDNPGAQELIVEFIREWTDKNDEWKESLSTEKDENDEDED